MTAKGAKIIRMTGLGAAVAMALGACGGDDDATTDDAAADADLSVVAEDATAFAEHSYTAEAGEVSVAYTNGDSVTHTLLVEGEGADEDFKLEVTTDGDTDSGTIELEPGEYRLWCDQSGHTMEATLTVD